MDRPVNPGAAVRPALHVVMLIRSFGFPEGMAATNRVRLLGRALLRERVDARVVSMRVSERPGEVRNHAAAGTVDGIPFLYAPGSTLRADSFALRRWRELGGYVRTLLLLCSLRAHGRLDCVFLADGGNEKLYPSVYVLVHWLRRLGVPVITELNEVPRVQRWLPLSRSRRLSHLAGVSGAVAISGWLSEWAEDEACRIRRRVAVVEIPIVVDPDEQAPLPRATDRQLFVYSASNDYLRDLAFVFRSMRHVWERFPEAELVVTGMRPDRVVAVAEGEGVLTAIKEGRLTIAGYLERPALLAAYQRASALLIPLQDDVRSRARFPSKIGEYLASGRPVVTTRVGEVDRFLRDGETAFIAPAGDAAAFADKMAAALEDPPGADAIGAAGRGTAEALFSYTLQGPRLKRFIESILDAGTGARGP